jgi:hypothetical protein
MTTNNETMGRASEVRDTFGNNVSPGDTIVYVVRTGSAVELRCARIYQMDPDKAKAVRMDGHRVTLTNPTCVRVDPAPARLGHARQREL